MSMAGQMAMANIKAEPGATQGLITGPNGVMKEKKKRDRFKGMSEEEVLKRLLPDHLAPDLDIIIVSENFELQFATKAQPVPKISY